MNQRRGVRWSASKAFLRPALGRANLDVRTNALVEQVTTASTDGVPRATGVRVRLGGAAPVMLRARREVLLAAGAIGSPQILQLSGLGPAALLRAHGVEVVRDLAGVGENLHDHLQLRAIYKVRDTVTLNRRARSLLGRAEMALEYAFFRTGPLTMPPSQLGAFAKSDAAEASANIEWHVQPLSLDKFGSPLHPFDAITPAVCNLRPTSRGYVRIKSNDPAAYPAIAPNYLATDEDRTVAVAGLRFTRRIMAAKALARFAPQEWKPGPELTTEAELARAAGDIGTTIYHPVGTCRMGNDTGAVVDDRLRVRGVDGLRVIDASIMPRIVSGNTNAPTVMIAEQGAAFIRAR
jgi:choline dehydrogenase